MGGRGTNSKSFDNAMRKMTISNNESFGGGRGADDSSKKIPSAYFQTIDGNKVSESKTLKSAEAKIIKNRYETGIIVDNDGFVLAAYKGNRTSVSLGNDFKKVKGNTLTHNHPSGIPLPSAADIRVSGKYGAKEVRMATTHGTGILSVIPRGGSTPEWGKLAFDYDKIIGDGTNAARAYKWLTRNAKDYGFIFVVKGKK